MTKEQQQESLTEARRACEWLGDYATGKYRGVLLDEQNRAAIRALIVEFTRLDAKEQKQIKAGKRYGKLGAQYGSKAPAPGKKRGRPRKENKQ